MKKQNMRNNSQKKSTSQIIAEKIKSGQIKMRPKTCFVLKTILALLNIAIIVLFALYLVSFIAFTLRVSGVWYLSGFGFRGVGTLLHSLPWLLILIDITLVVVLEILVKRFAFAYRQPILYSILAILALALLGGFVIDKTRLHQPLFRQAQEGHLPVAGKFYRDFGMPKFRNVHRGIVSDIIENGFLIETPRKEILTVITNSKTRFPYGIGIEKNDTVVVLGERDNGTIQAFGVRKIDDNLDISPQRHMPMPDHTPMY